jgi:hypothetical protein
MPRWFRPLLLASAALTTACECGGPFVAVDCALPGLHFQVLDADGTTVRADAIRTYQDGELVEERVCTPLDDECTGGVLPITEPGDYRVEVDVAGVTYAHDEPVDAIPDDGCCGGYYADADLVVVPGPDPDSCDDLDEDACAAEPACYALVGFPLSDAEDCVEADAPTFAVCDTPRDCDAALSLARPTEDGDCLMFSSCTPPGWLACDGPVPGECLE